MQGVYMIHGLDGMDKATSVSEGIYYGGSEEAMKMVDSKQGSPADFRFFFKYTAWLPGKSFSVPSLSATQPSCPQYAVDAQSSSVPLFVCNTAPMSSMCCCCTCLEIGVDYQPESRTDTALDKRFKLSGIDIMELRR